MNELSRIFMDIPDDITIKLENKIYHVYPEDSFICKGFYCSNSAKKDENPDGIRYSAIYLRNKKNVTIEGNNAQIIVHGKMTPILFYRCENITVNNLIVDYAVPTMSEFTVLDYENGEMTIRFHDDCRFNIDNDTLYLCGEKDNEGNYYWNYACNANKRYVKVYSSDTRTTRDFNRNDLTFEKIEMIDDNVLKCRFVNKTVELKKGEIFQTRSIIRDQVGSMSERCKNLLFRNVRMKFMHGLGMVSQFCENVSFLDCDFTPKEGRTIASTADFFQFSGCKGELIIDGCKAFGAQDDYINVHGTHLRIIETDLNKNTLTVRFMHPETWGFYPFEAGDRIEFIKWDTLIPYSVAEVINVEKINDTDFVLCIDAVPQGIEINKDVVENVTCVPDLFVRNCDFGPTSGRGILCTTRGEVIIENNRFCNLWGPALLIEDDCNFWFESGLTRNIVFRNNLVRACNFGNTLNGAPVIQVTPKVMNENSEEYVHQKLTVSGNKFSDAVYGKHVFVLEYLAEAVITGNSFDAEFLIYKKNTGNIHQGDNVIS